MFYSLISYFSCVNHVHVVIMLLSLKVVGNLKIRFNHIISDCNNVNYVHVVIVLLS